MREDAYECCVAKQLSPDSILDAERVLRILDKRDAYTLTSGRYRGRWSDRKGRRDAIRDVADELYGVSPLILIVIRWAAYKLIAAVVDWWLENRVRA